MALPRKRRKIFIAYRLGIILVLGTLAFALARASLNMYSTMQISKAEAVEMQARNHELKERRDFLKEEIDELSTEYGTEAALREKYGVAHEGETQIVIVGEEQTATSGQNSEKKQGFWRRFGGWFGF